MVSRSPAVRRGVVTGSVRSGPGCRRLCADRIEAASGVSPAAWAATRRCREFAVETPRQTGQPSPVARDSDTCAVDRARAVFGLWSDLGGGEAGRPSRLLGIARDLARLDDRGRSVDRPPASASLATSAAAAAPLPGRAGADRRLRAPGGCGTWAWPCRST